MHARQSRAFALGISAVVFTLTLAGTAPHAQDNGRERELYVSVTDAQGQPVVDVLPADIVVREDGARREVLRVSRAIDPIAVAILVDNSSAADSALVNLREALTRFADAMHEGNDIAIIGLASRPTILTDYTRDPVRLKAAINRIFPEPDSGMTLLDALVEVSRGLEKRKAERSVLLTVITDGPEHGHYDERSVLKAIQSAGAAFHAVTVGAFSSFVPDELRYRAMVLSLAPRQSGGRHDSLMAATGLPQALDRVARDLSSQLKVVYARPSSLIPPESVEVTVSRPGLTARGTPARRIGG